MELKEIQKILIKHSIVLDEKLFLTGIPMGKITECAKELLAAINYTRCCKSDSELLPDAEKEKLIEDAYWLNLQNLSGREDFEKAFRLGIETGVDETLEKLQG